MAACTKCFSPFNIAVITTHFPSEETEGLLARVGIGRRPGHCSWRLGAGSRLSEGDGSEGRGQGQPAGGGPHLQPRKRWLAQTMERDSSWSRRPPPSGGSR